jgi:uroporphyrin-3 C-methyltransferase
LDVSTPSDLPPAAPDAAGAAGPEHARPQPVTGARPPSASTRVDAAAAAAAGAAAPQAAAPPGWLPWLAGAALVLAVAAAAVAWQAGERVQRLESELVRRQQASADVVAEARLSARQAQELAREAAARASLQELRLVELTASRDQIDDVLQAVTRSSEENLLAELDASLRMAMHQAAITGSADAVVLTLRHAEERLARASGPAIDRVRRAVGADLARVRAGAAADPSVMADRLDEALRSVEGLPLLAQALPPAPAASAPLRRGRGERAPPAAAASASAAAGDGDEPAWAWRAWADGAWRGFWAETRALVRLTPVDHPEAALLAPEQAAFVRGNLQLRLLSARVAVLSRRFDSAQVDLGAARGLLERYFDRRARSVQGVIDTLRQVGAQARAVPVPRPEATLAAIAAASGGR